MTAKQIVEKLEAVSLHTVDLDEFSEEDWQELRRQMGDILRVLGGARKPAVQKARQALARAFMQLKREDEATHEPFAEQLDAMKAALRDGKEVTEHKSEEEQEADDEIFRDYLAEMGEFIEQLEAAVLALEAAPQDPEEVHGVFRLFHTIKGTAGVMEHTLLSRLAHQTENILDLARDGELKLSHTHIDLFLAAIDQIRGIHGALRMDQREERVDKAAYSALLQRLEAALNDEPPQPQEPGEPMPQPTTEEPPVQADEPAGQQQEVARRETALRIDTAKLDNLIDLVGELVISANLVREDELVRQTANLDFRKKVGQLSSIVGDLQRSSMALRMIPIGSTLQKMKRVVRDVNSHSDKEIDLVIDGQETEIDRHIVDRLYEPLVHLVRNACDHGVEQAEARRKAGKPEAGTVTVCASHQGNNILIDVSDDGHGLDPKAIRAKAKERGLLKEGDHLDDKDTWRLILLPGFSTAAEVTDISGRGVGMDVVNRAVGDLGGHIEAFSELGQGTTFRISLPLTLAIMEGMLVRVSGELFVIPVMNIRRIIHPDEDALNQVFGKGELIRDGERLIPLARLYRIFDLKSACVTLDCSVLLIVSSLRRTFALMVDELVGIQDVVVKSLGPKFRNLRGVSGSTILGDGSVGLILDINNLLPDETA